MEEVTVVVRTVEVVGVEAVDIVVVDVEALVVEVVDIVVEVEDIVVEVVVGSAVEIAEEVTVTALEIDQGEIVVAIDGHVVVDVFSVQNIIGNTKK